MGDGSKVVAAGEDLDIRTEDSLWEDEMESDTVFLLDFNREAD